MLNSIFILLLLNLISLQKKNCDVHRSAKNVIKIKFILILRLFQKIKMNEKSAAIKIIYSNILKNFTLLFNLF